MDDWARRGGLGRKSLSRRGKSVMIISEKNY
jgi:hypothetical protein